MKGLRAARVLGKKRKPGKHRRPRLSGHAGPGILLDEAPKLPFLGCFQSYTRFRIGVPNLFFQMGLEKPMFGAREDLEGASVKAGAPREGRGLCSVRACICGLIQKF